MIEPLDEGMLAALERDADESDGRHLRAARKFFERRDLAEGLYRLFENFEIFEARLVHEKDEWEQWQLKFYVCI